MLLRIGNTVKLNYITKRGYTHLSIAYNLTQTNMDYVIDLVTADNYHIETMCKYFECLALAEDWAKCQIGTTNRNGSVVGKVKIHQDGGENKDDCIIID